MHRRQLLAGIAGWVLTLRAFGQAGTARRRIAILEQGNKAVRSHEWEVLETQLRDRGYVEGRNLSITRRWADGIDSRLPQLAQEVLAGDPEVVLAVTTPAIQALKRLTDKVPIVMTGVADPVAAGLVQSLSRPGGNITGVSLDLGSVVRKRLELLQEMLPGIRRVGLLGPGANAGVQAALRQAKEAGKLLGVDVGLLEAASDPTSIARAFDRLSGISTDALIATQVMLQHHRQVIDLARRQRLPVAFVDRETLASGAFMVFGPEREAPYVHAADYVHRILQGAKPADLPVIQPTKYWLGVNLRAAGELGIKVPRAILLRADEVIQ